MVGERVLADIQPGPYQLPEQMQTHQGMGWAVREGQRAYQLSHSDETLSLLQGAVYFILTFSAGRIHVELIILCKSYACRVDHSLQVVYV